VRSFAAFVGPGLGAGPVYPVLGGQTLRLGSFAGSRWRGNKMVWVTTPQARGPIMVRGRELGGSTRVRFGGARVPASHLRLTGPGAGVVGEPPGWRNWPSLTRLRAGGCYEFDITGASLNERIVFRGAIAPTPGRRPI
jgi:hypothetical protein